MQAEKPERTEVVSSPGLGSGVSPEPGLGLAQPGSLRGYTPVQSLFLLRFQGLISKRKQTVGLIEVADWRSRLLEKALYSTYRDCTDLGIGEEASRLLRQIRVAESS